MSDVRSYGPGALLVTVGDGVRPAAFAAAALELDGVADVVPAARTVLVTMASAALRDPVADALGRLDVAAVGADGDETAGSVAIEVVYDGDDLTAVAATSGLSVSDVVALHSGGSYRCEFVGFAPGFAYLSGLDRRLELPRRTTPRTSVPAGSVAIAGPFTAVYPTASPGGWHLLGRTDASLWDVAADLPAAITPGTCVQFRPVTESGRPTHRDPVPPPPSTSDETHDAQIVVVRSGISTSFQDRGRLGYAALGVPRSGALDRVARDLANRLVGNHADACVIETAGGLVLEAVAAVLVADSASGAVQTLAPGDRIAVDPAPAELYAYLAVRGGFDVEPVLGSRSWDSLSRLGPSFPEPGGVISVAPDTGFELVADLAPHVDRRHEARVWEGPRLDWFVDVAFDQLLGSAWTVSGDVSRVGIRLGGPALARRPDRAGVELASEGLVIGAIQVPPDGHPVVMLADHPTTGGYPVIGVIDDRDHASVAQARPGSTLTFRRAQGP